ncbi:hypothetical protein K7432_005933 [Basidiobolus ranarum]|uniref:RING-type domain-containing protein n=1 Tax=Basidiobolus ranarum TaxID=34480 RepID=A0ABR2W392_9FUNG
MGQSLSSQSNQNSDSRNETNTNDDNASPDSNPSDRSYTSYRSSRNEGFTVGPPVSQPDSPRVLRMTPARRRRQMFGMYPFDTQDPTSERSLNRLRRVHSSISQLRNPERYYSTNRSQDNLFGEMEDDAMEEDSNLFGPTPSSLRYPESRRRWGPSLESTEGGTNQDSMTRLVQYTLGRIANSPENRTPAVEESPQSDSMLGRILATVASAAASHLLSSNTEPSEPPANVEPPATDSSRGASPFLDSFLSGFRSSMRNRPGQLNSAPAERDEPLELPTSPSFFRLFRLGSNGQPQMDGESHAPNASDENGSQTNTESNGSPQMVPVIIVGIRSVNAVNLRRAGISTGDTPSDTVRNLFGSNFPMANTTSSNDVDEAPESIHEPDHSLNQPSTEYEDEGEEQPNPRSSVQSRSYIIYVIGGTYPSNHPLLTTALSDNPTYEDLLLLSSFIGPARPPTTSQSEIEANLPIVTFDSSIPGVQGYQILNPESCQVCLCEYEDQDKIRVLNCRHAYHQTCIDKWLTEGANKCPICRGIGVETKSNEKSSREDGENNTTENAQTVM